jgi:hypothetical protein
MRGDAYFQQQSELLIDQYHELSDEDWAGIHRAFVMSVGGSYVSDDQIQPVAKTLVVKPTKETKPKEPK